ncbi:MAG: hypothetical protein IIC18_05220 [Bacteroidetes bacterium]|nr:hypothetical protein [Bacteroidota bacterium]
MVAGLDDLEEPPSPLHGKLVRRKGQTEGLYDPPAGSLDSLTVPGADRPVEVDQHGLNWWRPQHCVLSIPSPLIAPGCPHHPADRIRVF